MRLLRPRATNATRTARATATITAALIALTLATVGATTADARPWTALFDWQATSTTGTEHWTVQEQDPSPALPGPWYRTWLGSGAPATVGRGLGVRPLGGRVYDNGDPTQQTGGPGTILRWTPPGSSTITRAAFGQLRYRNESDGQYLRVRVATGNSTTNQTRDFGPAYGQNDPDTTYTPSAVTLTPTVPGLGVEAAMFTVCSPAGGGLYTCPNIPTSTGTFGRVGRIEITLDDPDQPVLQVQPQPAIDGGWVNKRRPQKLSVTATDPSSGIQRIQVQLKLGTSTRTLANRVVTCDPLHRTAGRAGLVCPATATLNATDPGRDSSTKDRTYIVTATDYAGNRTVQTLVVRRDLQKPTGGKLAGDLARVARNKASGRTGIVPATITGTDSHSGVARLEILARRQTGGRTYVIATADADCASGCKKRSTLPAAADLSLLPKDGRYRLQVRITDQAGNQKTFTTGTLFLDWKAPSAPKATVKISQRDGTASAVVKPGRDPAESSGRGDYYLLYPATTDDHDRAIRSGDRQVRDIVDQLRPLLNGPTRVVRSKTRQFPLPSYQLRNQQEPGYILQTDYVRTSSGERRVRVRVGRATVRSATQVDGRPCPARVPGPPSRYMTQPDSWQFTSYWAGRINVSKSDVNLIIVRHGLSLSLRGRTLTLRLTSARSCGPTFSEFSSAKILDSNGNQRGDVVDFRAGRGASHTITHTRPLPGGRYRVAFNTNISYGYGGQPGPAPLSAWIVCAKDPEGRDRCSFDLGNQPNVLPCLLPTSRARAASDSARRWNLCVKTARLPGVTVTSGPGLPRTVSYSPEIAEAHHIFPREFEEEFRGKVPLHNPRYLCWMRLSQHRSRIAAYNARWRTFFRRYSSPTRERILSFGRELTRSGPDSCIRQYK
jgi:hypothetical protein